MDALFVEWSEDRESATPRPLNDWLTEYPEHSEKLLLWVAEAPVSQWAETLPPDPEGEDRAAVIGRQMLTEMRLRLEAPTSLIAKAQELGLNVETLAARLDLEETLLFKLERRLLRLNSLPGVLLNRLADALALSVQQVRNYLAQPPQLASGAMYRADTVPEAFQQDFEAAIRANSDLTAAQKAYWLAAAQVNREDS